VAPKSDPLKGATINGGILRYENNRTYLVEKEQPKRSVFETGSMRHNVAFGEIAAKNLAAPHLTHKAGVQLFHWKEDSTKQKYDSFPITGKIGHIDSSPNKRNLW